MAEMRLIARPRVNALTRGGSREAFSGLHCISYYNHCFRIEFATKKVAANHSNRIVPPRSASIAPPLTSSWSRTVTVRVLMNRQPNRGL